MNPEELAIIWCALNCTTGPDFTVVEIMDVIEKRIGKKIISETWNKHKGNELKKVLLDIGKRS